MSDEQNRRDQIPHLKYIMCGACRNLYTLRGMENAFWPPLKKFLMNRKEGPTQRRTLCATCGTSGFFRKNVNKDGSKGQWRVLILPAVVAGFGTGRYTMCDLDPVEVARLSGTRYGL